MDSAEKTGTSPYSWWNTTLARLRILLNGGVILTAYIFFGPSNNSLVQAIIFCINWGPYMLICLIFSGVAIFVGNFYYLNYWIPSKATEEKAKLYDEYIANGPPSPGYNNYRVTEVEDDYNNNYNRVTEVEDDYNNNYNRVTEVEDDYNNNNNNINKESAPAFEPVQECNYYDVETVVEEVKKSKSYRMRKMEKKGVRMMEYQRMESERVSKTASWRSDKMDGRISIEECRSVEECRMSVDDYIMDEKKKRFWQTDQWQRGGLEPWQNRGQNFQWQNNVPQFQMGGVDQRQNGVVQWVSGFPQLQNCYADQWPYSVPQLQNDYVDQWQNGASHWQNAMVPWQGSPGDGSGHHHHESRSQRPVDGSGSNGYGLYLGISN